MIRLPKEQQQEDNGRDLYKCEGQEDKELLRELEAKFNELFGSTDDD